MNKKIRETLDYYQDTEFDKTMKDIKDNLIARIKRQEKEIDKLKNELEELEKNHDFRVDQAHNLQQRIDKAIEYITTHKYPTMYRISNDDLDKNDLIEILQGSDE